MTNWQELEAKYYLFVVRRLPVTLVRGEGVRVWDDQGREYLDFVAGIAVDVLGHCHPVTINALAEQAKALIHVSNWFYSIPQLELAQLLVENSCMDRVFFANSGAEANEGAVKLARKYGKVKKNGAYEVISTWNSFHGRTLGMVAATGKPAQQAPYAPLPPGFPIVDYDDIEAIKRATTENTAAILLEPIQGEGGVNIPSDAYMRAVRAWCDQNNILLIFDEVQTGIGRTGTLWGYQQFGVEPDIMTLAKGLGGGVPIGALLSKEHCAVFEPGDHGSTFGGNPLMCAVGRDTFRYVLEHNLTDHAAKVGGHLLARLRELQAQYPFITDVRGRGLLIAVEFNADISAAVVNAGIEHGLLLNPVKPTAIRLMPPLTLTEAEADEAVEKLSRALAQVGARVAG